MYKYSSGFAKPLSLAGAPSCELCLVTDHAAEKCALSMRRRGRARTSLLLRCDFSPCPAAVPRRSVAVSWWNMCLCNGAPSCTYITRVAHAECGAGDYAGGPRLHGKRSKSQTGG